MNTGDVRVDKTAVEPTYLLTEGTRQELELRGHATSPFTGALLVGSPDNVREVSEAEYNKVAREAAKRDEVTPKQTRSFPKAESAKSEEKVLRTPAPRAEAPKPEAVKKLNAKD